jgi:mRNA-degrading endonuclease RelE of RelBE toxin-antitoxin system
MYKDIYSDEIVRILIKLKKKDPSQHEALKKKIFQILENPLHQHKELRHDLKGKCRVHLGHFVLVFSIDHQNKTVSFLDYDHHDSIYE